MTFKRPFDYINNIDPSTEWYADFPWQVLRLRSIVSASALQVLLAAYSFVQGWPHLATSLILVIAFGIAVGLVWLRLSRIRRINSDEAIHRLTHDLRDRVYEINSSPDDAIRKVRLEQFYKEIAQNIASYFRERTGNATFNCVLRVASEDNGETVYRTVARSNGLADERQLRSVAESHNTGIAKRLLEHHAQGAYLITDRMEAARNDIWRLTANDTLDDVKVVLTVPINGWYSNSCDMLGILHLTTREGRIRRANWLPAKAFCDLMGHVLSIIYSAEYNRYDVN